MSGIRGVLQRRLRNSSDDNFGLAIGHPDLAVGIAIAQWVGREGQIIKIEEYRDRSDGVTDDSS